MGKREGEGIFGGFEGSFAPWEDDFLEEEGVLTFKVCIANGYILGRFFLGE